MNDTQGRVQGRVYFFISIFISYFLYLLGIYCSPPQSLTISTKSSITDTPHRYTFAFGINSHLFIFSSYFVAYLPNDKYPEAYLESSQTSKMVLFCDNS